MKVVDVKPIFILTVLFVSLAGGSANAKATQPKVGARDAGISFETKRIKLGNQIIEAEIADTDAKREHGLMFRESLPDNHGMLFIFDEERKLSFWMKNTLIPLSIGYFSKDRRLNEIHEMVPAVLGEREIKTYPSSLPAMYALEMPKGWYSKHRIKSGTTFSFVRKP